MPPVLGGQSIPERGGQLMNPVACGRRADQNSLTGETEDCGVILPLHVHGKGWLAGLWMKPLCALGTIL
jgi:hypothetical protein